jgi:long-chain fatty acid transport protein
VAAISNFGLASDYNLNWVGRYHLMASSLITGQVNPSIAYRVNEWLSIGAGFSFNVARLYDQAKINTSCPGLATVACRLKS